MVVSNIFVIFSPKIGEDSHFDYSNIFNWVETINQITMVGKKQNDKVFGRMIRTSINHDKGRDL